MFVICATIVSSANTTFEISYFELRIQKIVNTVGPVIIVNIVSTANFVSIVKTIILDTRCRIYINIVTYLKFSTSHPRNFCRIKLLIF
jgi:hypothetical protein